MSLKTIRNLTPSITTLAAVFLFTCSGAFAQEVNQNTRSNQTAQAAVIDETDKKPTTTAGQPTERKVENTSAAAPAPSNDPDAWHFEITPYLWLAGMEGDLRVGNTTARVDVSAGDVFSTLDFGFATQFEAGKGRFKFMLDEYYGNLGITGTGPLGQPTDVQPSMNIFEFGGSYAPVVVPNKNSTQTTPLPPVFTLEIVGGGRYTHFGLGLTRPNASAEGSRNIVDFFVGNRFKIRPHPAITLIGKYTVGGGGSHFAWTAAGLVDLRWKKNFSVFGGYQVLDMDADQAGNTVGFNGRLLGVIFGITLHR